MMKRFILTLFAFSAALLHYSCSTTISGGTGTETVNTFAMLPNGQPARGAHVQLIDASSWFGNLQSKTSVVLGSAFTDNHGYCSIEIPTRRGQINLQIDNGTTGLILPIPFKKTTDIGHITLQTYGSLSGTFASDTDADFVAIAGTAYTAALDNNRSFNFTKIPPGTFSVLGVKESTIHPNIASANVVTIEPALPKRLDTISGNNHRLLIDNFEYGIGPTSIGMVLPVLGWYALSDSLYYAWNPEIYQWEKRTTSIFGHSSIKVDSLLENNTNHVFTFSTTLDPDTFKANALVGISLKPLSQEGIDLSAMTAFSLRAWGNGVIRVRFETLALDTSSLTIAGLSHYTYCIALSPASRSYTIPVDSLRILDATPYAERFPWSSVSKHVMRIEFNYSVYENDRDEKLTLHLDDFYLEGVDISSFFASGTK